MENQIRSRMFGRLADLIDIRAAKLGDSYCAASRVPDDMSIYCEVVSRQGGQIVLEFASDEVQGGAIVAKPWMSFMVNVEQEIAEILAYETERIYERVSSVGGIEGRRQAGINLYAVNWLALLAGHGFVFERVSLMPSGLILDKGSTQEVEQ